MAETSASDVRPLPPLGNRSTLAERIRGVLAQDVVCGRMGPGLPLDESELARRFGVSRTPVREAIRQLEAIGLAHARPHRGAVVAAVTAERLDEMFAVMGELEAAAARESATRMSSAERVALERLHNALGNAVKDSALDTYVSLNLSFHELINLGSHNGFLTETANGVRARLEPFRNAQFNASLQRIIHSWAEHGQIVQAILQGDGAAAAQAMRDHIIASRRSYEAVAGR
jgi:DNA-binding GntR family transcriptional regulator